MPASDPLSVLLRFCFGSVPVQCRLIFRFVSGSASSDFSVCFRFGIVWLFGLFPVRHRLAFRFVSGSAVSRSASVPSRCSQTPRGSVLTAGEAVTAPSPSPVRTAGLYRHAPSEAAKASFPTRPRIRSGFRPHPPPDGTE